ncbi:sigma-G-dependent sporulation-specific acid-soluble spore protein CsgA [Bacillus sp. FJAT-27445]|uniref:sigma-G-dependent sporulation-specific acid-soluble spore protein CsgA n=1 Tax=Bacillus sp. FJAT-27445 TaxID=1679166 RepID=UPI000744393B|nr:sigma-G-dependent sporulation-specific acid-soluble spore protein CsgA [Bacillus sp. FJAT-27445]
MDQSLAYLREILSNYTENHTGGKKLYKLLEQNNSSTEAFVESLEAGDIQFLNTILPEEIKYAQNEQDEERAGQLNSVYEQLI